MQKINKKEYKSQVLLALKKAGKPIWLSQLHRKYGLPYATIHGSKNNPASKALKSMIKEGSVVVLPPRYYKIDSTRRRSMVALPTTAKENPRKYDMDQLWHRVNLLEETVFLQQKCINILIEHAQKTN